MCNNSFCQVEDDSEVRAAEAEMDEVDAALGQLIGHRRCGLLFCQVEDDSEVRAAEAEMDEVDAALGQLIGSSAAMRAVVLSGGGRQ